MRKIKKKKKIVIKRKGTPLYCEFKESQYPEEISLDEYGDFQRGTIGELLFKGYLSCQQLA